MLNDMLAAIEKLNSLPKPAIEYRLHPDDYDALRTEAQWMTMTPPAQHSSLGGLRIVLDPDAARLPRKINS